MLQLDVGGRGRNLNGKIQNQWKLVWKDDSHYPRTTWNVQNKHLTISCLSFQHVFLCVVLYNDKIGERINYIAKILLSNKKQDYCRENSKVLLGPSALIDKILCKAACTKVVLGRCLNELNLNSKYWDPIPDYGDVK